MGQAVFVLCIMGFSTEEAPTRLSASRYRVGFLSLLVAHLAHVLVSCTSSPCVCA